MVSPDGEQLIARRYRLLRKIGQGGMGVVWEGQDTLLNRLVAIKEVLLPPGLPPGDHERQLLRTTREARTAARLNNPSIVQIYDVAEQDGRPWIIMELVDALSLDEVVEQQGAVPVRQLADLGRQVLSALRAAHEAGILHRDVKPSNILVTEEGRAVLTDFGIATAEGDSSLTQTGMVAGSPSFLAPERARGQDSGPASDLWSLGATLYAALTGRSPFERGDTMATLSALLTEEPNLSRIPPVMHPVLLGLLQRDPAERLNAQQADELLEHIIGGPPQAKGGRRRTEAPMEQAPTGRRRTLLVAGAVAVAAVAGTIGWLTLGPDDAGPRAADAATKGPAATATAAPEAPSATPTPTPTPSPVRTRRVSVTRVWTSPSGWTIPFPRGWKGSRQEMYTEWLRRDGNAHLGVEEAVGRGGDPMEVLEESKAGFTPYAEEVNTLRTGAVNVPGGAAAEWEFTWVGSGGGRNAWEVQGETYHELRRVIVVGDTAYILEWTTREADWNRQQRLRAQVFRGFSTGGG
ncbi:serine/threonine-protein kinase [Streptosporangium sp. KLBMP 9127]|nr:serine/threonine protein kinase [Streptosporangium sp. KLBMP 9127]